MNTYCHTLLALLLLTILIVYWLPTDDQFLAYWLVELCREVGMRHSTPNGSIQGRLHEPGWPQRLLAEAGVELKLLQVTKRYAFY